MITATKEKANHTPQRELRIEAPQRPATRLPFVVYVLALGTFLMGTTEYVVAGLLPGIAGDLHISIARAGLMITVFAVGMIVGAPLMSMLTLRLPRRLTLMLALGVFAVGHVVVALASSFAALLAARFVTAIATGAFWAVANVVTARAAGPDASSRALGVVASGAMLASVAGVPLGAVAGQLEGWRAPFWALAVLALASITLIARSVPHDADDQHAVSIRSEVAALRSRHLWLVLAACAATSGGVFSAYSFIAPLLRDRTGLAAGLVPLVLAGIGVGSLVGTLVGGRVGDIHAHATTVAAPAATSVVLLALCLLGGFAVPTIALVVLLGLFGLGAVPVLMSLVVRFAGDAPTLASGLTVSAFNFGTAVGSSIAGLALASSLGATGPTVVGAIIAALTLIPTTALALAHRKPAARVNRVVLGTPIRTTNFRTECS